MTILILALYEESCSSEQLQAPGTTKPYQTAPNQKIHEPECDSEKWHPFRILIVVSAVWSNSWIPLITTFHSIPVVNCRALFIKRRVRLAFFKTKPTRLDWKRLAKSSGVQMFFIHQHGRSYKLKHKSSLKQDDSVTCQACKSWVTNLCL